MKAPANDGGSAFPVTEQFDERRGEYVKYAEDGMTLSDYFAAKAMQGFLSGSEWEFEPAVPMPIQVATDIALSSYRLADAMIKARQS